MKAVPGRRRSSSRPPGTVSDRMDSLTAAAAVLAMDTESDAGDDMEQEARAGECGGDLVEPPAHQQPAVENENENDLPERQGVRAANKQVSASPKVLHPAPRALSFVFCTHPGRCAPRSRGSKNMITIDLYDLDRCRLFNRSIVR